MNQKPNSVSKHRLHATEEAVQTLPHRHRRRTERSQTTRHQRETSSVGNTKNSKKDDAVDITMASTQNENRKRKRKEPSSQGFKATGPAAATVSSNWMALKRQLTAGRNENNRPRKRQVRLGNNESKDISSSHGESQQQDPGAKITRVLALDCEMVGVGSDGDQSMLARVSIVNATGVVVYDSFVAPTEKVTDYRTKWSGVRSSNLRSAPRFNDVQLHVSSLVRGRILVGHGLQHDLQVLGIDHPSRDVRDTSNYPPLMRLHASGRKKAKSLRELALEHLGLEIQDGEHSSVEDARAALSLYQKHRKEWEAWNGQRKANATLKVRSSIQQAVRTKPSSGKLMKTDRLIELASADYMADL